MTLPAMSLLAASTLAAIGFDPPCPTTCQPVTLRVMRTFTEDCLWEVESAVRREIATIEVALSLKGQAGCDQAMTKKVLAVSLGRLPAGAYDVILRWSDSETVERARLQVTEAPCGTARSENAT